MIKSVQSVLTMIIFYLFYSAISILVFKINTNKKLHNHKKRKFITHLRVNIIETSYLGCYSERLNMSPGLNVVVYTAISSVLIFTSTVIRFSFFLNSHLFDTEAHCIHKRKKNLVIISDDLILTRKDLEIMKNLERCHIHIHHIPPIIRIYSCSCSI